ncbi:hypothetical protein [Zongyangia hominis]|uniref:Phage tail sheath protein n=1 Tax=Zongyangia hominis TaxID=2763677 RepID=A0A926ECG7_9FIRM|nr:hypothetical protein [Zongyangia hominis]MBC8570535.1 hypothetical protein [Zongyangia hominis]
MSRTASSPASERPGVTSSYIVQSLYRGKDGALPVGLIVPAAAQNDGTANEAGSLSALTEIYTAQSAILLKAADILLQNGVGRLIVAAVPDENAGAADYKKAVDNLCDHKAPRVVVCYGADEGVMSYLSERIASDSLAQKEKIGLCACDGPDAALALAGKLNSERMMVCAGKCKAGDGSDSFFTACAMAGLLAATEDPSANLNGSALVGVDALETEFSEGDIQRMLTGGVTPFETVSGAVECIKPVSTRTTTDGVSDRTWHSIGAVMTIDHCMRRLRDMLKIRLKGAKNNLATRESIRSQVALELSNLCQGGIIDDFGPPLIYKSDSDPGVCVVELSFRVSGAMDMIHVAAHITM